MLVTMTVAVLFLSHGASCDGWTCAIDIGKMRQCILGEMVNFKKVILPKGQLAKNTNHSIFVILCMG
jgi:hypothetical protein